jgi:hypothetical protein
MSYILEALRKSEQERNPTEVPNLKTHHPMLHKEAKSKTAYWILGLVLLLVNGFLLAYIVFGNQQWFGNEHSEESTTLSISKPKIENSVADSTEQFETQVSQDEFIEVQPITTPQEKEVIASSLPIQKPEQETNQQLEQKLVIENPIINELDKASVPDIFDLDYAFQQKIPDMEFSTHIFVSDGGSFVIINGKNVSDGMAVDRGLVLVHILSDGVVLRYKGRQFFLASMTNWLRD